MNKNCVVFAGSKDLVKCREPKQLIIRRYDNYEKQINLFKEDAYEQIFDYTMMVPQLNKLDNYDILKTVHVFIGNNVEEIAASAFDGAKKLYLVVAKKLKKVNENAFQNCHQLR